MPARFSQQQHSKYPFIVAALCLLLQAALGPNLHVLQGTINFALVCVLLVGLSSQGTNPVRCGFVAGLLFDLFTTGPLGLMALLLTISGLVLALVGQGFSQDRGSRLLLGLVVVLAVQTLYTVMQVVLVSDVSLFDALGLRMLPSVGLTMIAFLIGDLFRGGVKKARTPGMHARGHANGLSTKGL